MLFPEKNGSRRMQMQNRACMQPERHVRTLTNRQAPKCTILLWVALLFLIGARVPNWRESAANLENRNHHRTAIGSERVRRAVDARGILPHYWLAHRKQKWLMCIPPKTGCSGLRRFALTQECLELQRKGRRVKCSAPSWDEIYAPPNISDDLWQPSVDEILTLAHDRTYTLVTVTKHPWLRPRSAFENKFVVSSSSNGTIFRRSHGMSIPDGSTFSLFLRELSKLPLHSREYHFAPVSLICSYEQFKYDYAIDLLYNANDLPFKYNDAFVATKSVGLITSSTESTEWDLVREVRTAYHADSMWLEAPQLHTWDGIYENLIAKTV